MVETAGTQGQDGIVLSRSDGVATVTLSNPERRNAFYPEMRRALTAVLGELQHELSVAAIVISGEGEHFCAGADVSRIPSEDRERTPFDVRSNMLEVHQLIRLLNGYPKPVVCAVEGSCAGAGLSIALSADIVIGAGGSRFVTAFSRLGLLPDMGMLYLLPQRVGLSVARRLMLASTRLKGAEAYRLGLIDELVEDGDCLDTAMERARELAAGAPLALAAIKHVMARGVTDLDAALQAELEWVPVLTATEDHREAVRAFTDKRPPEFGGR